MAQGMSVAYHVNLDVMLCPNRLIYRGVLLPLQQHTPLWLSSIIDTFADIMFAATQKELVASLRSSLCYRSVLTLLAGCLGWLYLRLAVFMAEWAQVKGFSLDLIHLSLTASRSSNTNGEGGLGGARVQQQLLLPRKAASAALGGVNAVSNNTNAAAAATADRGVSRDGGRPKATHLTE